MYLSAYKLKRYEWANQFEKSCQKLKKRLKSTPVLTIPEGEEERVIYSDAVKMTLGVILMKNGIPHDS